MTPVGSTYCVRLGARVKVEAPRRPGTSHLFTFQGVRDRSGMTDGKLRSEHRGEGSLGWSAHHPELNSSRRIAAGFAPLGDGPDLIAEREQRR